jgi:hypothetical protein
MEDGRWTDTPFQQSDPLILLLSVFAPLRETLIGAALLRINRLVTRAALLIWGVAGATPYHPAIFYLPSAIFATANALRGLRAKRIPSHGPSSNRKKELRPGRELV